MQAPLWPNKSAAARKYDFTRGGMRGLRHASRLLYTVALRKASWDQWRPLKGAGARKGWSFKTLVKASVMHSDKKIFNYLKISRKKGWTAGTLRNVSSGFRTIQPVKVCRALLSGVDFQLEASVEEVVRKWSVCPVWWWWSPLPNPPGLHKYSFNHLIQTHHS